LPTDFRSIFKQRHGWDGIDTEAASQVLRVFRIHFCNEPFPAPSRAILLSSGATILQGSHQGAQKSCRLVATFISEKAAVTQEQAASILASSNVEGLGAPASRSGVRRSAFA
jgi:hypothetical protein